MHTKVNAYRLFHAEGETLVDNGTRWGRLEMLRGDFPGPDWAIVPVDSVPDDWPEMTVEAGELVPAPAETIEARRATRHAACVAAVRSTRESRYRTESDPTLYDALEAFARNHPEHAEFAEWLAAKDRIRAELLKPETPECTSGIPLFHP